MAALLLPRANDGSFDAEANPSLAHLLLERSLDDVAPPQSGGALSATALSEGSFPLYAVYKTGEKWGRDFPGELTPEINNHIREKGDTRRYFFFYNSFNKVHNFKTWCKDRGGQNSYIYTRLLVQKNTIPLVNTDVTFQTHLIYSGYRFCSGKICEDVNMRGVTNDAIVATQVLINPDEVWKPVKGTVQTTLRSPNGLFEVRYRIDQISKNLSNHLFHLRIDIFSPGCEPTQIFLSTLRVLSKPPGFSKLYESTAAKSEPAPVECAMTQEISVAPSPSVQGTQQDPLFDRVERRIDAIGDLATRLVASSPPKTTSGEEKGALPAQDAGSHAPLTLDSNSVSVLQKLLSSLNGHIRRIESAIQENPPSFADS